MDTEDIQTFFLAIYGKILVSVDECRLALSENVDVRTDG
jgi:hypothetical protein